MAIRIVSIEDDPQEEATLERQLQRYADENSLELTVVHLTEAAPLLEHELEADLVFMDINLPGINGMDAAALLRAYDETTPLVFVTSLAQYAVRGYQVDAAGFIVKPVRYYDLRMAMNKVMRVLQRSANELMTFTSRNGMRAFPISSISTVQTSGHNVEFHFVSGEEPFITRESLGNVEKRLEGKPFIRTSQSQIANMEHIKLVQGDSVTMTTGEVLYFSRYKKKECLQRIAQFMGGTV